MQIITNNIPRQLIYGYELTEKEKTDFNYIDDIDGHSFLKYKGFIYDVSEFMRIDNIDALKDWDGYSSDSYFSGILIKYIDSDHVIVARYIN